MTSSSQQTVSFEQKAENLIGQYQNIRNQSIALITPLSDADATVQSMPDASPAKWHMGHTTWFFETLILIPYVAGYQPFDPQYAYLFNSYYESLGPRQPRPKRGMLTRPSLEQIKDYRQHVDKHVLSFLRQCGCTLEVSALLELGLHHEMQHQELLLTDILHLFAQNPLYPVYRAPEPIAMTADIPTSSWLDFEGGIVDIGHGDVEFAFDCEEPRHQQIIRPFSLASKPVTNSDWIAFIEERGYTNPLLWLSDGWASIQQNEWHAPLYWAKEKEGWGTMSLRGYQPIDPDAPVSHISYFEADAFARWSGKRLPTEFEWEYAAQLIPIDGNFAERAYLRPKAAEGPENTLLQMFGDVWEWTSSPYISYPGFTPAHGAISEYNGKFMCGQFVLKGGACSTPKNQMRKSYRNFFYPHQRWQFSGLRLAEDL